MMTRKKSYDTPSFEEKLDSFCTRMHLFPQGSTIVVGFSGGPDSMVLLDYLAKKQAQGAIDKVIAAHLDHEWRADSHKDVEFCRKQAEQRGALFTTGKLSELAFKPKSNGSKEDMGRRMRRYFLENVAYREKAERIALAHHMQDQQETFFIRLFRGSSLTGLTAMKVQHGLYVRPFLETNRVDILQYVKDHSLEYLTDPSNDSDEYLRNRIRKYIIPALNGADKRFDASFAHTLGHLQETENFLNAMAHDAFTNISCQYKDAQAIKISEFAQLHTIMKKRVLLLLLYNAKVPFAPSTTFFEEVMRFIEKPARLHELSQHWSLCKERGLLFARTTPK